jgi:hypothetical protein
MIGAASVIAQVVSVTSRNTTPIVWPTETDRDVSESTLSAFHIAFTLLMSSGRNVVLGAGLASFSNNLKVKDFSYCSSTTG